MPSDYNNNFNNLNKLLQLFDQNSRSTDPNTTPDDNTDFDTIINSNKTNIVKAAIPYMNVENQKKIAILIKFIELINTMNLYNNHIINQIPELNKTSCTKKDLLMALRPNCSNKNKKLIDIILGFDNLKSMMSLTNDNNNNLMDNSDLNNTTNTDTTDENLDQEELIKRLKQLMKE